jgi:hypothetical protein
MGDRVLLSIVGVSYFGIGEDLYLADDIGIVGFIDHGEPAFAQLLF